MKARRSTVSVGCVLVAAAGALLAPGVARADAAAGAPAHFQPARFQVVSAATAATVPVPAVSRLTIVPSWDASVTSSPQAAQVEQAFTTAAEFFESRYYDPITVKIGVGFGEVLGSPIGAALGVTVTVEEPVSYDVIRSALTGGALTADQKTAAAALPGTAPFAGTGYAAAADAMALGLTTGSVFYASSPVAGYVGLSSTLPFDYTDTTPVAGTWDPVGVFEHEISEVLGRAVGGPSWMVDNLFRYSASEVLDTDSGGGGYLSADGGATALVALNALSGGDAGDYADPNPDAYNAFTSAGTIDPVTSAGTTNVDLLGYHSAPIVTLVVTPSVTTTRPGSDVSMTAALVTTAFGSTSTVDVTSQTTFTITNRTLGSTDGAFCSGRTCRVTAPGTYTITGVYGGNEQASATVTVTAGS